MQSAVKNKFKTYPEDIRPLLHTIRDQIILAAQEHNIASLEETTKWGEPAYTSKQGSTLRFDWKPKTPDQYCIYFNCQTNLIETFKEIYGDLFNYEGNRAIVFKKDQVVPLKELRHCLSLSLRYHKLKDLPFLGA